MNGNSYGPPSPSLDNHTIASTGKSILSSTIHESSWLKHRNPIRDEGPIQVPDSDLN